MKLVKRITATALSMTMLTGNAYLIYGQNVAMQLQKQNYDMQSLTTKVQYNLEGIKNPQFEEGLVGWENPEWAVGEGLMFSLSQTNGVGGGACAKLTSNTAIEQDLTGLEPYQPYILKIQIKGTAGKKVEIGCENGENKFKNGVTLTNEYQEVSVKFTSGSKGKARIYVYLPYITEVAYVDNFSIEKGEISSVDGGTVEIVPANQLQTFDGWGTTLAWFANIIGGWSQENREQVSDLLFDQEKGLGLNIVRYNIGGGDAPGHDHMRPGGELEGFATGFDENGKLIYDWEADSNQITMLHDAIDRGVDITEAFSNTPPYFMTESGCASGSEGGWADNLKNDYYDDFAEYLTEVVAYFKEEENIVFDYLEPLNEPYTNYWKANGGQEGCHFDVESQEKIIQLSAQYLKDKELTDTVVAAMDESVLDTGLNNFLKFSQQTKDSMEKWNVHTYGGSKRKESKNAAAIYGKDLWMSEVDLGGSVAHNPDSIVPAIELAQRITTDMKNIQPTAWCIWQAVENWPNMMTSGENSNWGLILANFEGEGANGLEAEAFRTTKKYYSMMQFSKFIKPGSVMLEVGDNNTLAFYDKTNENLVIVYINDWVQDNKEISFDLTGFNSLGASSEVYVTSKGKDCKQIEDATIKDGVLTDVVETQSITTFVLEGVSYDDAMIKLNESTIADKDEVNRFEYTGDWGYTANAGEYVNDHIWSGNKGNTATLYFEGTRAQIYGVKAPNHGIANVTIDDREPVEVDFYSVYRENTIIFDTERLGQPLESGQHTMVIEVTGEKNNAAEGTAITLDYAKISKDNTELPLNTSIKPGTKWTDTKGERIQAHGGGMWYDEESQTYYWYGEDKTYGYRPLRGVRCYSSKDLYNWEDHGLALAAIEDRADLDTDPLYTDREEQDKDKIFKDLDINTAVMERPKVIYNEKTDKWVMWFHADGPTETSDANYAKAKSGLAISDSPTGPFTYIGSYRLDQNPNLPTDEESQGMARDMNLFVDDDGTGYIIYSSEHNGTMYISKLTDDYLDVAGWHKDGLTDEEGNHVRDTIYKGVEGEDYVRIFNGWSREAPAMFKYDGKYYLITSGCTGWAPNQAKYAMADSVLGPWEEIGDPCIGDTNKTTFYSQSTYVIPVDEASGKFIYMGDRWTYETDSNLADSRYIWLPIQFESDGKLGISWVDEWDLETLNTMGKIEVVTDLPEQITYGVIPEIPIQITVKQGGNERTEKVRWEINDSSVHRVGKQTIYGELENGGRVSFETYVVPEDVIYFVNSGDNTSEEYVKMKKFIGNNLINEEMNDQAYDKAQNTWGYTGTTDTNVSGQGMYQSIRYVTKTATNREMKYTFDNLESGKYTVYIGFYDPWAQWANGNRKANVFVNDEMKQSNILIDGVGRSYEYADIQVEDQLEITIQPANSGSNSDIQVSWLMIAKEMPEVPEISSATISLPAAAKAGEEIVATVGMNQVDGKVYAQDLVIKYDPEIFTYLGYNKLGTTEVAGEEKQTGSIRLLLAQPDKVEEMMNKVQTGIETLELRFKVNPVTEFVDGQIEINKIEVATVEQGNTAIQHLAGTKGTVVVSPSDKPVDKSVLNELISVATKLVNEAVIGTKPGNYPQEAKVALVEAIAVAQQVADNSEDQLTINEAVKELQTATELFKQAQIKGVNEDVDDNGVIDVADLALVAYYFHKEINDANRKADVNVDGTIDIYDLTMIAGKILY